jgi:hypothetical protein
MHAFKKNDFSDKLKLSFLIVALGCQALIIVMIIISSELFIIACIQVKE